MNTFFNPNISRSQVAFQNYLDQAVAERPLPWRTSLKGEEWLVVASNSFPVVRGCADWAQAQAIVNYAHDSFMLDAIRPR